MATVSSLTKEKIQELVAGWEDVNLSQEQINALVAQLWTSQGTVSAEMEYFQNVILPQLVADLGASSIKISELNDTRLPELEADLAQQDLTIDNLRNVEIPAIQEGLVNTVDNVQARPKVFVQPDEPPPYDDLEERDLVVGDTWFNSANNNEQRIWNGVEWSTFNVDIADFSLTVRKFMSTSHMIY